MQKYHQNARNSLNFGATLFKGGCVVFICTKMVVKLRGTGHPGAVNDMSGLLGWRKEEEEDRLYVSWVSTSQLVTLTALSITSCQRQTNRFWQILRIFRMPIGGFLWLDNFRKNCLTYSENYFRNWALFCNNFVTMRRE